MFGWNNLPVTCCSDDRLNKFMGYNMSDAGMEMSDGHMKDTFDVNAQTAMIWLYKGCGERETNESVVLSPARGRLESPV